jgi:hypothetical protein
MSHITKIGIITYTFAHYKRGYESENDYEKEQRAKKIAHFPVFVLFTNSKKGFFTY